MKKLKELKKKYTTLRCKNEYCSCNKCDNKELCDKVYYLIYSIKNFY